MRNQSFNFDEALKQLQSGKKLLGTDGILTPLIKQLTEAALQAEIEHYLSTTSIDTRKNGYTTSFAQAYKIPEMAKSNG